MSNTVNVLRGPSGMLTTWEMITPEIAGRFIESKAPNRGVRVDAVRKLIVEMQGGCFLPSPQGIQFNSRGQMIDGEHRCTAILKSGVSAMMMVTRNVPDSVVPKLDSGTKRRDADHLRIAGWHSVSNGVAAAVRVAILGCTAVEQSTSKYPLMVEQYGDFLEAFATEIESVGPVQKCKGIGNRVVMGVMIRAAINTGDLVRIKELVKVLETGMPMGMEDSAGIALQQAYLKRTIRGSGRVVGNDAYWKTQSAVASFLKRKPVQVLRPVETEQFPLPIDRVPESCRSFM